MKGTLMLRRPRALVLLALAAVLGVLLSVSGAVRAGNDVTCADTTLLGGTYDNVEVPEGAWCTLLETQVNGNIKNKGGLFTDHANITGNVESESWYTQLFFTQVGGNVQMKGNTDFSFVRLSQVGGDLQAEENSGHLLLFGNRVGGNLQTSKNTGGGSIEANNVGGNLQCSDNLPALDTFGNSIAGEVQGCSTQ